MKYSINWAIDKFETGESIKFIFFWGHTAMQNSNEVGKECLSQWYEMPFHVGTYTYKTAEHWMMSKKALLFKDEKIFLKIINCETPGEAKRFGREINNFDKNVWDEKKFSIVKEGNIHKFTQNPELFSYLKNTNNRVLVEASPQDRIWGIGKSANEENLDNPYFWDGENLLGFALMEVRDTLNNLEYFKPLENSLLPLWLKYPNVEQSDMFWRMGEGEGYLIELSKYLETLNKTELEIYKITYPTPEGWENWYE